MYGLAQSLVGSAVDNARRAARQVEEAVRERRDLAPADEPAPGALSTLPREQALDLLAAHQVGRFCYVARTGVPDVVPVNYALRGDRVLVRSGPGPKLQAAQRHEVVALEVDEIDEQAGTGRSVVVAGRARVLADHEVDELGEAGPRPWATGVRRHVIEFRAERVTGRRLT